MRLFESAMASSSGGFNAHEPIILHGNLRKDGSSASSPLGRAGGLPRDKRLRRLPPPPPPRPFLSTHNADAAAAVDVNDNDGNEHGGDYDNGGDYNGGDDVSGDYDPSALALNEQLGEEGAALAAELKAAFARYEDDMGRAEAKDTIAWYVDAEQIATVMTDATVATMRVARDVEGVDSALSCEDDVLVCEACVGGGGGVARERYGGGGGVDELWCGRGDDHRRHDIPKTRRCAMKGARVLKELR
ncbi:hypothetical protein HYPSUDRAFT_58786 [Hypholoma sublateritium FD-334 SS-4]|uniref:Uncharacterized protein n=1 Tax=Hypholoma sublateritium (strain FD-334 SS-4) TaxID=945553 RepID=A0A0D2P458_HYPSF|nr:hypothetical protein HYPSUDRAFT_58883 [Hypholoma sublateritium FD-334 SS-4]KJA15426.1 hypothetical protein HYPSUDRAFT_58786 [Hypholoma sublateritium FD-334 SS-4]